MKDCGCIELARVVRRVPLPLSQVRRAFGRFFAGLRLLYLRQPILYLLFLRIEGLALLAAQCLQLCHFGLGSCHGLLGHFQLLVDRGEAFSLCARVACNACLSTIEPFRAGCWS